MYCFSYLCFVLYGFFRYVVNVYVSIVNIFCFNDGGFFFMFSCMVCRCDIIVVIVNIYIIKMCYLKSFFCWLGECK